MKIIRILLLLCWLLPSFSVRAQTDAWQEARALFARYDGHEPLSFKATISMFPAARPTEITDRQQAFYALQQQEYHCRIGTMELVRNKQYWLTIDHADKTILLAGTHTKQAQSATAFDLAGLLERLQQDKVTLVLSRRGSQMVLQITGMPDPRLVKYEFVYDPQSYLIKQMTMELEQSGGQKGPERVTMQMDYYQYVTGKTTSDIFSEKKYVLVNGKKAALQTAYASYQLINQL